jgi:hypothetical protein
MTNNRQHVIFYIERLADTFDRRSSKSFFLYRGFNNAFLVASSHISLRASEAEGNVVIVAFTWSESDGLGFAFLGGNLRTDEWQRDGCNDKAYLSRGSSTLKPIIIPRGIEPGVCKSDKALQN